MDPDATKTDGSTRFRSPEKLYTLIKLPTSYTLVFITLLKKFWRISLSMTDDSNAKLCMT